MIRTARDDGWRRRFAFLPITFRDGPETTTIWLEWVWVQDCGEYRAVRLTDPRPERTKPMTNPTQSELDALEVTKADRDLAAAWASDSYLRYAHITEAVIREGGADRMAIVQAFARHRIAAIAALQAENARLREGVDLAGKGHATMADVEQADRDAAAAITMRASGLGKDHRIIRECLAGVHDETFGVQAFARHRIAAEARGLRTALEAVQLDTDGSHKEAEQAILAILAKLESGQ